MKAAPLLLCAGIVACGSEPSRVEPPRTPASSSTPAGDDAAAATVVLGPTRYRIGETWTVEEEQVDETRMVFSSGSEQRAVHRRSQRFEVTVVATDAHGITERLIAVTARKRVDEYASGKVVEEIDPTAGKTYRFKDGTFVAEDGAGMSKPELKSVRDAATLLFDRTSFSTVPDAPIRIGDVFAHPAADEVRGISGSLKVTAITGADALRIVELTGQVKAAAPGAGSVFERTERWTVRARDGRVLRLDTVGEKRPDPPSPLVNEYAKLTSTLRFTYE